VDEHLANTARKARPLHPERLRNHRAMVNCGKGRRRVRRRPDELPKHTNMEHIMQTRTRRQFQADSHFIDLLSDEVGPDEVRLELPLCRVWKGRRRALLEA